MAFGIDDAVAAGLKVLPLTKTCRICMSEKPLSEFYYRSDSKKYRTECFKCKSDIQKKYYTTRYAETAKRKSFEFRKKDQKVNLFVSCKATARKKKLNFNLKIDDIVIPEYCKYLGVKLTNIQGKGRIETNASIDRIDPSKGYVKGNIQVISFKANTMKQNASKTELLTFCRNVLKDMGGE